MLVKILCTPCIVSGAPLRAVNTNECVGASSARQRFRNASSCVKLWKVNVLHLK